MPRMNRSWVDEELGGYHIISRTVGQQFLLGPEDKDYFVGLLQILCDVYFVDLHSFCVMDNHFHLLVTMREQQAQSSPEEELADRLWKLCRPEVDGEPGGKLYLLRETGVEVVRERFGSLSRFMQELKQSFSRYYNNKHERKGYLWSDRFKAVVVSHGEAQLTCSAYIDLNPVRAGIVERSDQYRWSSAGLESRNPSRYSTFVAPLSCLGQNAESRQWYRCFLSITGGYGDEFLSHISPSVVRDVRRCVDDLKMGQPLSVRIATFSQGVVIGTSSLVESFQESMGRVVKKSRCLWKESPVCTTRVLSAGYG